MVGRQRQALKRQPLQEREVSQLRPLVVAAKSQVAEAAEWTKASTVDYIIGNPDSMMATLELRYRRKSGEDF